MRILETDQASEFKISKGNFTDNIDARSKLLRLRNVGRVKHQFYLKHPQSIKRNNCNCSETEKNGRGKKESKG